MAGPFLGVESPSTVILARLDEALERRWGTWCLALLCILTAVFTGVIAARRPLEHDEIFTFWTARQSSLASVYAALVNHADNHPPIDYWLRYLSMHWFGASELGLRLPSMAAFLACLAAAFRLARRYWGTGSGLVAAGVLLASQASSTAYFARSYALVLLWTALGLLLWRQAAEGRRRRIALAGLGLLFAGTVCLHFYAPFHMLAVVVAELARTGLRKKIDWPVWGAFCCAVLGIPLILPLLPYAHSFVRGFWTAATLQAALQSYGTLFLYGLPAFFGLLVVWAALRVWVGDAPAEEHRTVGPDALPELLAAGYLTALPFVVLIVAKLGTGAFQPKYAISSVLGVALLMAFACSRSRVLKWAALISIGAVSIGLLAMKAVTFARSGPPGETARLVYAVAGKTDLPVVLDSAQTFLESAQYAPPALRERLFFLLDLKSAERYGKETTDQKALPGLARISPFRAVDRAEFLQRHPHFLLLYEGGWVLQELVREQARMQVQPFAEGLLFEVSVTVQQR